MPQSQPIYPYPGRRNDDNHGARHGLQKKKNDNMMIKKRRNRQASCRAGGWDQRAFDNGIFFSSVQCSVPCGCFDVPLARRDQRWADWGGGGLVGGPRLFGGGVQVQVQVSESERLKNEW